MGMDGADDAAGSTPRAAAAAETMREGQALSAENLAWEGPGRRTPPGGHDVPVLRVEGFEGPLDWLLEQARAGRVDLARLSVLALVEQCVAALERALAGRRGEGDGRGVGAGSAAPPPAPPLQRLAEWVVMAAWLAWLRSRLLLPEDDPEARAARDEAEALRRQLADRARVRDAVAWLDARPQLGRDVFARGGVSTGRATAERAADLPALLRTYAHLMGPVSAEQAKEEVYRPRLHPLWRVQDAMARIARLLPELPDTKPNGGAASLWRFLPWAECLAAAGLAGEAVRDPALLARSAVASTFVAGLELARQGRLALTPGEATGEVGVCIAAVDPR
jgi:segregation and condensation protein A